LSAWIDRPAIQPDWLVVSGGGGRGKTGLAAAAAHRFLAADPTRTAFFGRLSPVHEQLAGETGAAFAQWLQAVGLLIRAVEIVWPDLGRGRLR